MLTSAECRAKSAACRANADSAMTEEAVLEWETMAHEWLRLAGVAEQQEALEAELGRADRPDPPRSEK